ncbi:MAG: sel1 repeat family protein [Bacteroides sp.]|nr:sel1 repeat family protein [Bacteroides sp.]
MDELHNGNTAIGIKYLTQAANKGSAEAQYQLGLYYYEIHDLQKSKIWLTKAAEQNHSKAKLALKVFIFH